MAPTAKGEPKRPRRRAKPATRPTSQRGRTGGARPGGGAAPKIGRRLSSPEEIHAIRTGVPVELMRQVQKEAGFTQERLSKVLGIPKRTLLNRMKRGQLNEDEGDRVLRLKRILEKATETFDGDKDAALSWLGSPNRALGGEYPFALVSTGAGGRAVEEVLGRMDHGLYS